tara:strand:- start:104 stop:352 length:249 start_codon:yes stop_codon:yes gene_type:complete
MKELKKKLTEKLIKRVFNHSELIEEIITDFKESEEFKQLILSDVSQQRELLIAFDTMRQFDIKHDDIEESIDYFLKHKESYL